MPNWVNNHLQVRGLEDEVEVFVKAHILKKDGSTQYLDYGADVPEPEWTEKQKKEQLWYNWRVDNWGVKWEATDVSTGESKEFGGIKVYNYEWESPWAYPAEWLEKCGKKYPNLDLFLVWEEEQGFGGSHQIRSGKTVHIDGFDIPEVIVEEPITDDKEEEAYEEFREEVERLREKLYEGRI